MAINGGLLYDDNKINGIYNPSINTVVREKSLKLADLDGNVATTTRDDSKCRLSETRSPCRLGFQRS